MLSNSSASDREFGNLIDQFLPKKRTEFVLTIGGIFLSHERLYRSRTRVFRRCQQRCRLGWFCRKYDAWIEFEGEILSSEPLPFYAKPLDCFLRLFSEIVSEQIQHNNDHTECCRNESVPVCCYPWFYSSNHYHTWSVGIDLQAFCVFYVDRVHAHTQTAMSLVFLLLLT